MEGKWQQHTRNCIFLNLFFFAHLSSGESCGSELPQAQLVPLSPDWGLVEVGSHYWPWVGTYSGVANYQGVVVVLHPCFVCSICQAARLRMVSSPYTDSNPEGLTEWPWHLGLRNYVWNYDGDIRMPLWLSTVGGKHAVPEGQKSVRPMEDSGQLWPIWLCCLPREGDKCDENHDCVTWSDEECLKSWGGLKVHGKRTYIGHKSDEPQGGFAFRFSECAWAEEDHWNGVLAEVTMWEGQWCDCSCKWRSCKNCHNPGTSAVVKHLNSVIITF